MFRHATIAFAYLAMPSLAFAHGPVQSNEAAPTPAQMDAQQRALHDVTPLTPEMILKLTPEMIRDLSRRLSGNQRAQEESVAHEAQMLPPVTPIEPAPVTALSTDAWQRAMQDMMPLTPEYIEKYRQILNPHDRSRM